MITRASSIIQGEIQLLGVVAACKRTLPPAKGSSIFFSFRRGLIGPCAPPHSAMTKKVVLKIGFHGDKDRKHVLKAVAKVEGIREVAVDDEKGTLTVIGNVDAVCIVNRLRRCGHAVEIDSVGPPPKPPEKKQDPPKEPPKPDPPPPPPCCRPCPPPCPPYPSPCYYEYDNDTCSIT